MSQYVTSNNSTNNHETANNSTNNNVTANNSTNNYVTANNSTMDNVVAWDQNTLCLKERSSQKRNTQNLNFKEENISRFYSWGLKLVKKKFVQKRSSSLFFLAMTVALFVGLLILSYQ